ncbi:mitochondrial protein [Crassisporium funariophilum]|nr:mitochondrial protein [Crassisporium funariophilum]
MQKTATSAVRKILVVGGNGFIGSAVCKAALARGIQVTSVSSSGRPYRTAKGHSPAWTSNVDWQKGDALHPQSFANLFSEVDGVVHTIGTLIEDGLYKTPLKQGNIPALFRTLFQSAVGGSGNPLERKVGENPTSYEALNRDSALRVCDAFMSSSSGLDRGRTHNSPRPFVYLSAEDIGRPVIPARYIETKREAERGIEQMMHDHPDFRGVYIRPSLVYHAHHRPLTTPAAVLLDISAAIHKKMPQSLPTPSSVLRSLGSISSTAPTADNLGSSFESMANALSIPPIHVDHVADAICVALDSGNDVRGVVGVQRMRELLGWSDDRSARDLTGA